MVIEKIKYSRPRGKEVAKVVVKIIIIGDKDTV